MPINHSRHEEVFYPHPALAPIHILGCGAVGSHVAFHLAKLGMAPRLYLWDGDDVASHNVANQMFGNGHVGHNKAKSIAKVIKAATGDEVGHVNECFFNPDHHSLHGVVYMLVDSMDTRRDIWNKSIKNSPYVDYMIETRMGATEGRIYSLRPTHRDECERWERTLYSSARAVASACGVTQTLGATANIIAGYAVWSYIDYVKSERDSLATKHTDRNFCTLISTSAPEVVHNFHPNPEPEPNPTQEN